MAFCPNCGAQATGAFCPNCGTAVAGASASSGTGSAYSAPPPGTSSPGITHNVASMLCYCPFFIGLICSIVFLVVAPYNRTKTVRFNAFQALFLHLALFLIWIALGLVIAMFAFVTHGVGFALYPILSLCIFVLFIVLMFKAYNNQTVKLPIIGDLAEKQA
jgi:uncharacterized membrane protein